MTPPATPKQSFANTIETITDAKAFLDEFIEVRKTLSTAIANGGEWCSNTDLEK
ncbi:MAG: hypothetical protein HIU91_10070 [Acidobacteria bacterium]|nr:hypothetical protein [Acidobacteriota bacterium]